METLANWEGEWTTSHPQHADPSLPTTMTAGPTCSCCFDDDLYGGGGDAAGEGVFEPAQLIISQLPTHPVDQLLLDGLVAGLAASDCNLRGQTFDYGSIARPTSLDCYPETSPPASGESRSSLSNHQAFWSVPAAGSIHTHDSFKKRKRDWNPDPDPKKRFTLAGSGSEYEYPNSGRFKLIRGTKSSSTLSSPPGGGVRSRREEEEGDVDAEAIQQMKEMMYRAAALRPVNLGAEVVEKPRRKNVRISSDPQTVAARQRRERISERLRVLQKLVPGGCKMDTASMLDEAANYLKFLRSQVNALEAMPPPTAAPSSTTTSITSSPSPTSLFSANQMMPSVGSFNLSNWLPSYNNNNNDGVAG